jgi:hypothetical protein
MASTRDAQRYRKTYSYLRATPRPEVLGSGGGGGGTSGEQFFFSDVAGSIYTSGSTAFVGPDEYAAVVEPSDKGTDVFFYVSGSGGTKDTVTAGVALFGGDVVISGTLHGGSPLKIGTNTQITGTFSQGFAAHAIGVNSHAQGYQSIAEGVHSHAAGIGGYAFGSGSYAAGSSTKWGLSSTAWGEGSHAEGLSTTAVGIGSHAEGERTVAGEQFLNFTMTAGDTTIYITGVDATSRYTGDTLVIRSDIGVNYTVTYSGIPSYDSVNNWTVLPLDYSFDNATVSGDVVDVSHSTGAHAEGIFSKAFRAGSHAEGLNTEAIGAESHAEGSLTSAQGAASHAEGASTAAIGDNSHAEGFGSYVSGNSAHGEGDSGVAGGTSSHSEGSGTKAMGDKSHAEGTITYALGVSTHAEGYDTTAGFAWMTGSISAGVLTLPGPDFQGPPGYSPNDSFGVIIDDSLDDNVFERTVCDIASWTTVGPNNDVVITLSSETRSSTKVYAGYMVAGMGYGALSHVYGTALDEAAHAEGLETVAAGIGSHAQGYLTLAAGKHSHAEGYLTVAIGSGSHAAGSGSIARGPYSYAGGANTIASGTSQTVVGTYNTRGNTTSLFVVGNGSGNDDVNRSDVFSVTSANVQVSGSLEVSGSTVLKDVHEELDIKTGATATVTHDLSLGSIFCHSGLVSDFTANFTNVPTTNNRAITTTLILSQSATPYIPNALQINGFAQTILWSGGSLPAGNANKKDVVGFSLIRSGSTWTALGQLTSYG